MFTGFTPETMDFLWGIRMNNNRDWFLEHKKQYVSTLYEPMKALAARMEARMEAMAEQAAALLPEAWGRE